MALSETSPRFDLQPTIEQQPFQNKSVQQFFAKWCEANDSIKPEIINRQMWEKQRSDGLLQKQSDGSSRLILPKDLQLWEMLDIIEAIDQDTFTHNPARAETAVQQLHDLGETFRNAGIYLHQRLPYIDQGRQIAESLSQDFYQYGQFILERERSEELPDDNSSASLEDKSAWTDLAADPHLSDEETTKIDAFLAGDSLLVSRQSRVYDEAGQSEEQHSIEEIRRQTLAQYFRVAQKAFELEQKSQQGEIKPSSIEVEPWQRKVAAHRQFIEHAVQSMNRELETPKRELNSSIFRRGLELLQQTMPFDSLPDYAKMWLLHLENGEQTLREALHITQLKSELDTVRKTRDAALISATERTTMSTVQLAISAYQAKLQSALPAQIRASQTLNCVGYSTLGTALISELGLNFLSARLPEHNILLLITEDGQVEWRDMQSHSYNQFIKDRMLEHDDSTKRNITTADIVAFSKHPTPQGIRIPINGEFAGQLYDWPERTSHTVVAFEPHFGQEISTLDWVGHFLLDAGLKDAAENAFRQEVALDPLHSLPYRNFAGVLFAKGKYDEAATVLQKSIAIDPSDAWSYYDLGLCLSKLSKPSEAVRAYEKSIAQHIDDPSAYILMGKGLESLGRKKEAAEAYRSFLASPRGSSMDEYIYALQVEEARSRLNKITGRLDQYIIGMIQQRFIFAKWLGKKLLSHFVTITVEE